MKKITFFITIIFILFIALSYSSVLLAGNVCSKCDCMAWGVIWLADEDKTVEGVKVEIEQVRSALKTETYSDSRGIYSFNFYDMKYLGPVIIMATDHDCQATTITLKPDIAVRQDFNASFNDPSSPFPAKIIHPAASSESSIVYVTESGNCYHIYGCQYLQESCKPIPYGYCYAMNYTACSVCIGSSYKEPEIWERLLDFTKSPWQISQKK